MVVTAQLLPCQRPAIHAKGSGWGRVVMRASLRSASPAVIAALQADMHAFFQELFEGRLALIPVRPCPNRAQILSKMVHRCQDSGIQNIDLSCSWSTRLLEYAALPSYVLILGCFCAQAQ